MPSGASGETLWWLGLGLLGLVVGLVGGMFGVGGGFLLIPLLNVVFRVPLDIAVGTGLCQVIGTAVAAYLRHRRLQQGEVKIDWIMLAGSLLGVTMGAHTLEALSTVGTLTFAGHGISALRFWISLIYIVLLTSVAFWILHDARVRPSSAPLPAGPLTRCRLGPMTELPNSERRISILLLAYIGLGLGFLSGLVGIGGGIVLMPILMYGIGMRLRMAAGTGIVLLLFTALVGTFEHARLGHVNLALAMVLLAGSTLGAPVGATFTSQVDGRSLRAIFGYLVLLAAAAVLWDLGRALTR